MDKMREEFEAWCDEQGYASDKYSADDCVDKYKHLAGVYVISDTRLLWEAWEASRAALCIDIPSGIGEKQFMNIISQFVSCGIDWS